MNMLYCNGRNHWGCVSLTLSRPPTPRYRGGFHQIEATPGLSITFPVRPHPGRHVSRLSAKRRGVRTLLPMLLFACNFLTLVCKGSSTRSIPPGAVSSRG
eukprot:7147285-Pyramimonas_sp.AAC.1